MARLNTKKKKLSSRHKAFLDHYLRDPERNARKAYLKVYPTTKLKAADSSSSLLLKNPNLQAYIEKIESKATEKTEITAEWIKEQLKENHVLAKRAKKYNDSNRALELLGKSKPINLFAEQIEVTKRILLVVDI